MDLASWLAKKTFQKRRNPEVIDLVRVYLKTRDALALHQLRNKGWKTTRIRDKATRQAYLLVRNDLGEVAVLAKLDGTSQKTIRHSESLQALNNSRIGLCVWGQL